MTDTPTAVSVTIFLLSCLGFSLFKFKKTKNHLTKLESRFSGVISIDSELIKLEEERQKLLNSIESTRSEYLEKRKILEQLLKEVALYSESMELAEMGIYEPHFKFDDSESFKKEIIAVRTQQKKMQSDKLAISCKQQWTVDGSKAKGTSMTNQMIKLTARAFNNECEASISNVTWNNIDKMEKRIIKAFDTINNLNSARMIKISQDYLDLKLKELRLTHEYRDKKQKEKEEQVEIRRQMREEAKLQQEVEKAAKEEAKYEKLLLKAKEEASVASGIELQDLQAKIAVLNMELETAHAKNVRAKSMAEQTRSGHVYIISNEGSFGGGVYKIGMTRRLDPLDRIKELGDASVPFIYDIHAMIYSKDAPALEARLHTLFDKKRVNRVNTRKEFFEVGLEEIKRIVLADSVDIEFIETAEAREYRESRAIRAAELHVEKEAAIFEKFPDSI